MLNTVKSELMITVPSLPEELMDVIYPVLIHLNSVGVRIMFMVSGGVKEEMVKRIAEVSEVRDRMFGGEVIADGREVVLLLGEEEPTLVIWSDHKGLANFAKDYFQYLCGAQQNVNKTDF